MLHFILIVSRTCWRQFKKWLLLSLACYLPGLSPAQISISVGAGVGGSLAEPQPVQPDLRMDEYVSLLPALRAFEASLGSGVQTRLRVAYDHSPYLKFDLDIAYFAGFARSSSFDSVGMLEGQTAVSYPRLQLTPGILLSLGDRRFTPFLRLGMILPQRYRIDYQAVELRQAGWVGQSIELEARTSIGSQVSLGLSYRLGAHVRLFYEAAYLYQQARPTQSRLQAYQIDGEDKLSHLQAYQVEGRYPRRYDHPLNHPDNPDFDPARPLEIPGYTLDASLLTMNLGLAFSFK